MSPSTAFRIPESEKSTAQRLTAVLDAKVSLNEENKFTPGAHPPNIDIL